MFVGHIGQLEKCIKQPNGVYSKLFWQWAGRDLNPRPLDYQSSALAKLPSQCLRSELPAHDYGGEGIRL